MHLSVPAGGLQEDDGFATAPQYPLPAGGNGGPGTPGLGAGAGGGSGQLGSAWDPHELVSVGLPPRVVDPALRRNMRVVGFACGCVLLRVGTCTRTRVQ